MIGDHDQIDHSLPAKAADQEDRSGRETAEGERRRFRWLDLVRTPAGGGEQQRLRLHIAQAGRILSPKGPIHAFVAQNPLQGLEHLPFDRALREAQRLLGGRGYLSNEAFRRIYANGRITRDDLVRALEAQAPHLVRRPTMEVRGGSITARDACLVQLLHGIDPLPHGTLRWQVVQAKATSRFRQDLPPETRASLLDRAWQGLQQQDQQDPEAYAVSTLWSAVLATFGLAGTVPVEELEARAEEALLHRVLGVARDGAMTFPRADLVRSAREALERDIRLIGPGWTLGDFCQRLTGARITGSINDQMIRWCAAFLDEGLAGWPMPDRERGFFDVWRKLAERDHIFMFMGVRNFAEKIHQLPPDPEDTVILSLRAMGVPEEHWTEYLSLHLAALPGWAGMVKWRETHPDYEMQERFPINLTQYLAVRLFYEVELIAALCRSEWGIEGTVPALHAYFRAHPGEYFSRSQIAAGDLPDALASGVVRTAKGTIALNWDVFTDPAYGDMRRAKGLSRSDQWFRFSEMLYVYRQGEGQGHDPVHTICREAWPLFQLAQLLGLSAEDIRSLRAVEAKALLALLDDLPPAAHGPIWLQAYETHYREQLLALLHQNREPKARTESRPAAQVIFCLDVREEGIRRHLEAQADAYETIGTAGFFGVPMVFRSLSNGAGRELCPIVVKPRHTVVEVARPGQVPLEIRREHRTKWKETLHAAYHRLETNFVTAYFLIDLLGIPFGFSVVGKTILSGTWRELTGALRHRLLPTIPTSVLVGRPTEEAAGMRQAVSEEPRQDETHPGHHAAQHAQFATPGFSAEEQADLVEGQLRIIGLTSNFARLILFCGHGSTTENNPYAAAYHCGACGGNRGGSSGRTIAAMASNPAVRALLSRRGIVIADDTHFLGGEHDTAADRFTFFDTEDIPDTHREEFQRLVRDLQHAAGLHAQERCRRLPLAPEHPTPEESLRHVQTRTVDWAQVYPEWGHATCASMLIGRRALTHGVFLDRRAYLQSYDPDQDPDGAILEEIMTAFIPVVRGISLDYYFSYADSGITGIFGAGTKALHNVVGLIGVMQGSGSDLKSGLPTQGVAPLHEPMRAQVIVESHPAKVASIIERHKTLENIFKNQWAHLIARDPETREFLAYLPDGTWEHLHKAHRS
jgi:hypothetical protein